MIALELTTFIGRFHPLFVHLPIGFILLAILLEWWEGLTKKEKPSQLVSIAWLIGGFAAFVAALCGWYLGETGLYEEQNLFWHRWIGIALVPITFLGWWIKRKPRKFPRSLHMGFNLALILLLAIEGHKGGNLTHGEGYLMEFAPAPVQNLFSSKKDSSAVRSFNNPDSVAVYSQLIAPILDVKCVACHNNEIKRGNLNLSHPDSLQLGGDGEAILVAGSAADSELFRRITLPQTSIKFMPPTNNVLTYDEIKTIAWWIDQGASFEKNVAEIDVPEDMKPLLLRRFGLDTRPRPWYEKVQIEPLDSTQIVKLEDQGFTVKGLGGENPLLDVSYSGHDLTAEKIKALIPARQHITWLTLTDTNIEDDWLENLSNFTNLTRLELDKTEVSDEGLRHLKGLPHLEALNLYGSEVSDASLPILKQLPELKRVYLSETKVTLEKAEALNKEGGHLSVVIASFSK
ncbi:DUF2231 domain-containing protein [Pareuzebyella sediminis]|uniref:DUF2231 domain-containing protein n=1 Tax=Pareuzebyella sediminis TaxID=2607998 RepID=UPI0011EDCEC3|nr:DUF2231 domain-containing protein [Pareuzebyella sediminis]